MDINNIPEALSLPIRLKLISCLVNGKKTFNEIKSLIEVSDGNLSVQLTKLEDWKFVRSTKMIENKKTKTTYELTDYGLNMLKDYVNLLKSIIIKNE